MSEPRVRVAPWEDFVLRLIAFWKLAHGVFFLALGILLLSINASDIPKMADEYIIQPFKLDPESKLVDWILDNAGKVPPWMLFYGGLGSFFYSILFFVEGIGLWLRRHWAEYLVVVVSGSLLPIEFFELFRGIHWWKIAITIGNLLVVGYLIHRLMLDAKNKALQQIEEDAATAKSGGSTTASEEISKVP